MFPKCQLVIGQVYIYFRFQSALRPARIHIWTLFLNSRCIFRDLSDDTLSQASVIPHNLYGVEGPTTLLERSHTQTSRFYCLWSHTSFFEAVPQGSPMG